MSLMACNYSSFFFLIIFGHGHYYKICISFPASCYTVTLLVDI